MSGSSAMRCRNGHPIVVAFAACRTCGAPTTMTRAVAPAGAQLSAPAGVAGRGATRQEIAALLLTILATIALVGVGVALVGAGSLG